MLRAFTSEPYRASSAALQSLRRLQPLWNKLYDRIGRDHRFLREALALSARGCAWEAQQLAVHERVHERAAAKPQLLLPNSVYLQGSGGWVHTVGNVQAGEPYQLQLVHALHSEEHAGVSGGPLHAVCDAIAAAARLVHPARPCVAVLSKPVDRLALRTRADVRGIGARLKREHGVGDVLYVSMADLAHAHVDGAGDLRLGARAISVVYSRYDFSHPFGAYVAPPHAAVHGEEGGAAAEAWREWPAVEALERSRAVVSAPLGCRLAHRRVVQHALARRGGLERFLAPAEAASLRGVLPAQWHLGDAAERAEAAALVAADPEGFVAKNMLRPRTGSGATQDRHASGGALVSGGAAVRALLRDEARRQWYLLSRRVAPRTHDAEVHTPTGATLRLEGAAAAASEVATYGVFLAAAGGGAVLRNETAGVGARTRPADPTHPLAAELGYGALSSVQVGGGGARAAGLG